MTLSLFLIGALHTMIFAIFQVPENFLLGRDSGLLAFICKVILYVSAIVISFCHQWFCRLFGLRRTLYLGLIFNVLGISTMVLDQNLSEQGWLPLILLNMVFFGAALTSVINALVTYVILEYPKKVGVGIVALFAFFNIGAMMAPLWLNVFRGLGIERILYPFLLLLLGVSIWYVHANFFDPAKSGHLVHLKKGSMIWRELHYRLGLFLIAIIAYGMTETTFSLWGFIQIQQFLGETVANDIVPFFWLFTVIGQILLLIPLYFLPPMRVFYVLIFVIMGACFYFPLQTKAGGFIVSYMMGGIGCSAIFPILLSLMEKEMIPYAQGSRLLHYIEVGISVMLAGYFIGVGTIDLWVQRIGTPHEFPVSTHFHMAIFFIALAGAIGFFMRQTAPKLK